MGRCFILFFYRRTRHHIKNGISSCFWLLLVAFALKLEINWCKITSMSNQNGQTGQRDGYLLWKLPRHPFDYTYLINLLAGYRSPRDKISRMIRKQEIIQVKKGLYVLSPEFGGEIDLKVLANLAYGPSYISMEYALSYWGLIPEKVEEVTSMTNKRNKSFDTPLGRFSYKYLENSKYWPGVQWLDGKTGSFLMASKEKAICDRLARVKGLTVADMDVYLEEDLRIDTDELEGMDTSLLKEIRDAYKNNSVAAFCDWFTCTR